MMVALLGFLRSAALFYHYLRSICNYELFIVCLINLSPTLLLSGVSAPVELTEILPADQEFAHLTKYLGLPSSPRLLLDSPFTLVLVRRWMSHPDLRYVKYRVSFATGTLFKCLPISKF